MNEEEIRKLLHPDCEIVSDSTWGDHVEIKRARNADVVIVALNDGSGLKPVHLCLPHQVYIKTLAELCVGKCQSCYFR